MNRRILEYFITIGLLVPGGLIADQPAVEVSQAGRIKTIAKLAGYGALTITGIGLSTMSGGLAIRPLLFDPKKKPAQSDIDTAHGCNKCMLKTKKLLSPSAPEPGESTLSHYGSLLIGTAITGSVGLGMTFLGARGLRNTMYGQTQEEKQAEQKQNEKIKQTIKETGRMAFDISRRSARVALYGIATAFGFAANGFGIISLLQSFADTNEAILSVKRYKNLQIAHAKQNVKPIIVSAIAIPIGTATLIFGIKGLRKEYKSWKESTTKENIVATVQAVKDKLEETLQGAVHTIIPYANEVIESKVEVIENKEIAHENN